jgi:iron complex transport system substrate-binding protein
VSLHDVTTDLVVSLGATEHLVGVMEPVDPAPEIARAIVGVRRVASVESVLAVAPDLVLGYGVVEERDPELVRGLERAGIDVRMYDPERVDDVLTTTREVAAALGEEDRGRALATFLAQALVAPSPSAKRPRVFVFDCCDPPFTAGGGSLLSELITRAGGQNVFAELDADWAHVSWEEVLARRPELVLVHTYGDDGSAKLRLLDAHPALRNLPRFEMPLRRALAGPRAAEGFAMLRQAFAGGLP